MNTLDKLDRSKWGNKKVVVYGNTQNQGYAPLFYGITVDRKYGHTSSCVFVKIDTDNALVVEPKMVKAKSCVLAEDEGAIITRPQFRDEIYD